MKDEVLIRYLYGKTTDQENQEILDWIDADPNGRVEDMNRIHYTCLALDQYGPEFTKTKPKIIERVLFKRGFRYAVGIAASIAILCGVWYLGGENSLRAISDRITSLEVPPGQFIKITLEDGTDVTLNAGSRLEYPPVFEKKTRRVKLSGEALFEVAHNAERPFFVETFASQIEVLGTKFNVLADEKMSRFSTTLVEGRVKVCNLNNPSEVVVMNPHDVVSLVNGHLHKTETADFKDLCWTEGLIHIKKMPFVELMAQFERSYDVKIVYNRTQMPEISVLSGEIRVSDGLDHALRILQQVADFSYERDLKNNVVVIK